MIEQQREIRQYDKDLETTNFDWILLTTRGMAEIEVSYLKLENQNSATVQLQNDMKSILEAMVLLLGIRKGFSSTWSWIQSKRYSYWK